MPTPLDPGQRCFQSRARSLSPHHLPFSSHMEVRYVADKAWCILNACCYRILSPFHRSHFVVSPPPSTIFCLFNHTTASTGCPLALLIVSLPYTSTLLCLLWAVRSVNDAISTALPNRSILTSRTLLSLSCANHWRRGMSAPFA